jgi:potassium channel subfamily K
MNGKMFNANISEKPPGVLGGLDKRDKLGDDDGGTEYHHKNDPESAAQRAASDQAESEVKRARKEGETGDERATPQSRRHYHSMLIKEIGRVMKHLNSSPPRRYSFDEWAWYLKLIGEDESSPETHRKAWRKANADGDGIRTAGYIGAHGREGKTKWSWLGKKSPLMGNKEEAEWVLERLTRTLERELEAMKREEEEGTGDWAEGGAMRGTKIMERVGETGEEEGGLAGNGGPSIESTSAATQENLAKQN